MNKSTKATDVLGAAKMLGVRVGQIYNLLRQGILKGTKTDKVWSVELESVEAYRNYIAERKGREAWSSK